MHRIVQHILQRCERFGGASSTIAPFDVHRKGASQSGFAKPIATLDLFTPTLLVSEQDADGRNRTNRGKIRGPRPVDLADDVGLPRDDPGTCFLRNRTLALVEIGQLEVWAEAVEVETQVIGVAGAKVTSGNCFAIRRRTSGWDASYSARRPSTSVRS